MNYIHVKNVLIKYLEENDIPLIIDNKLNSVSFHQQDYLKSKYGIDLKEEMLKYDFSKFNFDEETLNSDTEKIIINKFIIYDE